MTTITYTDHEGGAPVINWQGREFTSTVPVELDPEDDKDFIEAARGNRFFSIDDGSTSVPDYDETIVGRGEVAARAGKRRIVPVAYRGEDKRALADAWLFGFDRVPDDDRPEEDQSERHESPLDRATSDTSGSGVSVTQQIANDREPD